MAILLVNTTTPDALIAEIDTGTLWGISLGTTKTRSDNLFEACPESVDIDVCQGSPDSFTEAGLLQKSWYLRGML